MPLYDFWADHLRQQRYEDMAAAEVERLRPAAVEPERWESVVRYCVTHSRHTLISAARLLRTVYDAYGEKGLHR